MHTLIVEQEIVENLPAEVVNSSVYMDQVGLIFQKQQADCVFTACEVGAAQCCRQTYL